MTEELDPNQYHPVSRKVLESLAAIKLSSLEDIEAGQTPNPLTDDAHKRTNAFTVRAMAREILELRGEVDRYVSGTVVTKLQDQIRGRDEQIRKLESTAQDLRVEQLQMRNKWQDLVKELQRECYSHKKQIQAMSEERERMVNGGRCLCEYPKQKPTHGNSYWLRCAVMGDPSRMQVLRVTYANGPRPRWEVNGWSRDIEPGDRFMPDETPRLEEFDDA